MISTHTLRRTSVALLLALALLGQALPVLAANTGGITGSVTDDTGAPVVGATVTATSASAVTSVQTDKTGHFVFLTLPPDTYTITTSATGYEPASVAGVTVFASQMVSTMLHSPRALKTIADVHANVTNLVGLGFENFLTQFISVLQGPVALFVAMVAVLAGAFFFIQGREGHDGLRHLGMIGIAVGILAAMPRIFAAFGGQTSGMHI